MIKSLLVCITLMAFCIGARADSLCTHGTARDFAFKKQSLRSALMTLASECELTLLVKLEDIERMKTPSITGCYTAADVLQKLLQGSGLEGVISAEGLIRIHRNTSLLASATLENQSLITPRPDNIEHVLVKGMRLASYSAAAIKRDAPDIRDVITEIEIGKMPDHSLPDALQRLPGVAIEKRLGDSTKAYVRGFDQNLVLMNGETFLTGMEYFMMGWNDQLYTSSLEAIPLDLLTRIDVHKSYQASDIEGSVGGTVNLYSRNPFGIDDEMQLTTVRTNYGKYSKDLQPELMLVLGKNWNSKVAGSIALSTNRQTTHVDRAQNFIFGALLYEVTEDDPSGAIEPHITPNYVSIEDIEQQRHLDSLNIALGFKPNAQTEWAFNYFLFDNSLERRDYQVHHEIKFTHSSLDYVLAHEGEIPYVRSGTYEQFAQIFSTFAESAHSQAHNGTLTFKHVPNSTWNTTVSLSVSTADYEQQLGNRDILYTPFEGDLPIWVGDSYASVFGGENIEAPTGWAPYFFTCQHCYDNVLQVVDYDVDAFQIARYRDNQFYQDINNSIATYARANGNDSQQDLITARADFNWTLFDTRDDALNFGFRVSSNRMEFTHYRYLTNFGDTKGAASPAQFDQNGRQIAASTFDPAQRPGPGQVGVREAYYYDLCNNGGIPAGETCDISGDGSDDNLPFGPWRYALDATEPMVAHSHNLPDLGMRLSSFLYDDAIDIFNAAPGYIPWYRYGERPDIFTTVDDFLPSQNVSGQFHFADAAPIINDIDSWIRNVAPNSPTRRFNVPRLSFSVALMTQALYGEYHFVSQQFPLTLDVGLRISRTAMEIDQAIVNDKPKYSLTNNTWAIEGVGDGWSRKTEKQSYTEILPSFTGIWNFNRKTKLRMAAGQAIARPDFFQLALGLSPQYISQTRNFPDSSTGTFDQAVAGDSGNPDLKPESIVYGEVSLEHYYGITNFWQLSVFQKFIENTIINGIQNREVSDESDSGKTTVPVTMPVNLDSSRVLGTELNLQNTWANGLGIHFNYSYINSESDIESLSKSDHGIPGIPEHYVNITGYYEASAFSIRLAHSWRSEYISPYSTFVGVRNLTDTIGSTPNLVKKHKAGGQWDLRATWAPNGHVTVGVDVLNIFENEAERYLEFPGNIERRDVVEPRYIVGVKLHF